MDIGGVIMFAPGTEVQILNGIDPDKNILPVANRYVVVSYDNFGIIVKATDGAALGRNFYISKSTPVIMMEVN
jgi:hypothetical protein